MKVAFDHQIFSMQRYGGVSRYFLELASRLPADTVSEVSVVAPLHVNAYLAADSARRFTSGRYVPYNLFGWVPVAVRRTNKVIAPLAWSQSDANIVHETYYSIKPFGNAQRRVVTVYDMIHELFIPTDLRTIAAKRTTVDRADHVICISENTRQDLIRLHNVDPERTSVVHLGYSLTEDANDATADGGRGRPTLLYVGHRDGYKNFDTLLEAYSSSATLRNFELIAFGGNPLMHNERKRIEQLGIAGEVRFESGSDRDLAARYRSASAFIYPSKYEGFGIPPLEAMSHGCPVVCSSAGSIPEVVGNAGLYFDPNSSEELRAVLERVVTSENLRADLRSRGYARLNAFSWDTCAAATAEVYRKVM